MSKGYFYHRHNTPYRQLLFKRLREKGFTVILGLGRERDRNWNSLPEHDYKEIKIFKIFRLEVWSELCTLRVIRKNNKVIVSSGNRSEIVHIFLIVLLNRLFGNSVLLSTEVHFKHRNIFKSATLDLMYLPLHLLASEIFYHTSLYESSNFYGFLSRKSRRVRQCYSPGQRKGTDVKIFDVAVISRNQKRKRLDLVEELLRNNGWNGVVMGDNTISIEGTRNVGFLKGKAKRKILGLSRYIVLLSDYEPWGLAIDDGLSQGLTPILSPYVGSVDIALSFYILNKDGTIGHCTSNAPLCQDYLWDIV